MLNVTLVNKKMFNNKTFVYKIFSSAPCKKKSYKHLRWAERKIL